MRWMTLKRGWNMGRSLWQCHTFSVTHQYCRLQRQYAVAIYYQDIFLIYIYISSIDKSHLPIFQSLINDKHTKWGDSRDYSDRRQKWRFAFTCSTLHPSSSAFVQEQTVSISASPITTQLSIWLQFKNTTSIHLKALPLISGQGGISCRPSLWIFQYLISGIFCGDLDFSFWAPNL